MTSGTGSISLTGLLGGTAGSIDTTTLISQLMQAAALPQTQLQNQLTSEQSVVSAYQAISSKMSTLQTAAEALTDPTAWTATAASSSSSAVVATSSGGSVGSTTFNVLQLASAQVSTIAVAGDGTVVSDPTQGITITGADGTAHQVALTSGAVGDVASAINSANVGVRASVVTTDSGQVLQLSAASTGTNGAFTTGGFESAAQTVVAAQNAQVGVGTLGSGGYTVSSQTNTFTGVIPGVTFSVSAPATGVTVTVASDEQSISDKIQALVTAANAANTEIGNDSGQGAVLEGNLDVDMLQQAIAGSVSNGTSTGASLKTWGIDIDKTGTISFDPDAFAAAYATDPTGTQTALTSFATSLDSTSTGAIDPISGTITAAITSGTSQESDLNTQISSWSDRLTTLQQTLQTKYSTMETTLAQLQSQQTYLTSMLNSLNNSQNSNSSSSN